MAKAKKKAKRDPEAAKASRPLSEKAARAKPAPIEPAEAKPALGASFWPLVVVLVAVAGGAIYVLFFR